MVLQILKTQFVSQCAKQLTLQLMKLLMVAQQVLAQHSCNNVTQSPTLFTEGN
jgi:hypothetical protein